MFLVNLPAEILAHGRLLALDTGETLFSQGEIARSVYWLQSGCVRLLQHTPEGRDVCLRIFAAGDLFAFMALVAPQPFPGTGQAMMPSTVISIPGEFLREQAAQHPELALALIDLLVDRLHVAYDRVREMAVENAEKRIARALVHLAQRLGRANGDKIHLEMPLSRQDIAEITGTRLETVSRVLSRWEKREIVSTHRAQITILQLEQLIDLAET